MKFFTLRKNEDATHIVDETPYMGFVIRHHTWDSSRMNTVCIHPVDGDIYEKVSNRDIAHGILDQISLSDVELIISDVFEAGKVPYSIGTCTATGTEDVLAFNTRNPDHVEILKGIYKRAINGFYASRDR